MKNLILLCTIVFLSFWKLPATLADDSDIFGSSVDPNVMLLIDSSGSMNNTVPSIPYDLNTTYNTLPHPRDRCRYKARPRGQ